MALSVDYARLCSKHFLEGESSCEWYAFNLLHSVHCWHVIAFCTIFRMSQIHSIMHCIDGSIFTPWMHSGTIIMACTVCAPHVRDFHLIRRLQRSLVDKSAWLLLKNNVFTILLFASCCWFCIHMAYPDCEWVKFMWQWDEIGGNSIFTCYDIQLIHVPCKLCSLPPLNIYFWMIMYTVFLH